MISPIGPMHKQHFSTGIKMEEKLRRLGKELDAELRGNILAYWMQHAPDLTHGGFVGKITRTNRPVPRAPKGSVLNARILWTFSAACRMLGDKTCLDPAGRAYNYFLEHFIDPEYGGVYWELDYLGNPTNPRKQIYALAFAIYAMTEYYMACGDKNALATAVQLYEIIETRSLDRRKNGYIEALSHDWQTLDDLRLSEKDANESKTMNTHLHILEAYASLFRVWKTDALEKALENVILLFADKFIDPATGHLRMFFDDDWNLRSDLISYGHDIECSWLLYEAAEVLGKKTVLDRVRPLSLKVARENLGGLDRDHGLFNEFSPKEGRLDTDKHWWQQAEALVGYFNAWELSGDPEFLENALGSWEFIKKYIIDREHGEWFWKVNREGIPYPDDEKAGFWKCPYHNSRACMEIIRRINSTFN
jgi:mannobiose 2-epimerase